MSAAQGKPTKLSTKIGRELKESMKQHGLTQEQLALLINRHHSSISNYIHGKAVPIPAIAAALSEALLNPRISEMVIESRMRTCVICERRFVDNGNGGPPARTCSASCRKLRHERERMGHAPRGSVVTNHRWEIVAEQVRKFCFDCNPDGVCRDGQCHLRGISPLPLHYLHNAERMQRRKGA